MPAVRASQRRSSGANADTSSNDFVVRDAAGHPGPAAFIFVSENGGIDGWNPNVGVAAGAKPPSTVTEVAHDSGARAVYKGLAQAQASDGKTYLYAANFRSGRVEVCNSDFKRVELPGGRFTDPLLPRVMSRPHARGAAGPRPCFR